MPTLILKYDFTNKVFGRLTCIRAIRHEKWGTIYWWVRCECGTEKYVSCYNLRIKAIASCGCDKGNHVRTINSLKNKWKKIMRIYKERAGLYEGREFLLTPTAFKSLIESPCYYCGEKNSNCIYPRSTVGRNLKLEEYAFRYNGIDRVDNTKGYSTENCVSCCKHCNIAKHSMSVNQFKSWISKVHKHMELA